MRDGDIDRAAVELFGGVAAVQRRQPQSRPRRLRRERAGQPVDQRDLGVFRHSRRENRAARRRVETGSEVQRRLDMLDGRRDQRRDFARPRRRFHAGRVAHEQIVGEQFAQAAQSAAHRRLRQPDPGGRPRHRPLPDQRVERFQQVQIDGSDIHVMNEEYTNNRFDK